MSFHMNVIVFALILSGWCGYVNTSYAQRPKEVKAVHIWRHSDVMREKCDLDFECLTEWFKEKR
jgi:hypothetical protein